jgi:hypothetical protein
MYSYQTIAGIFSIVRHDDGRWHVVFDDESLGSYVTSEQGADALAGGRTMTPNNGVDTVMLAIPRDLSKWKPD